MIIYIFILIYNISYRSYTPSRLLVGPCVASWPGRNHSAKRQFLQYFGLCAGGYWKSTGQCGSSRVEKDLARWGI